jgi:hypothetical protein
MNEPTDTAAARIRAFLNAWDTTDYLREMTEVAGPFDGVPALDTADLRAVLNEREQARASAVLGATDDGRLRIVCPACNWDAIYPCLDLLTAHHRRPGARRHPRPAVRVRLRPRRALRLHRPRLRMPRRRQPVHRLRRGRSRVRQPGRDVTAAWVVVDESLIPAGTVAERWDRFATSHHIERCGNGTARLDCASDAAATRNAAWLRSLGIPGAALKVGGER